jgi:hypothetical protein
MIGCILATVGAIGLLKMAHHRRHGCGGWGSRRWGGLHHHHHHGCDDGDDRGTGGPGRYFGGRFGFGRGFVLRGILDRLEASPAQERVIVAAADEFHEATAKLRDEGRRSRSDVAGAFRKPSLDEVMMGELFARHDTEIEGLRKAFVGFTAKVHDALDEKQRERLADMIESGPRFFRRGPFGRRGFDRGFDRDGWE